MYKIESFKDKTLPAKSQAKRVSDEAFASVLSVNSDNQYMKASIRNVLDDGRHHILLKHL